MVLKKQKKIIKIIGGVLLSIIALLVVFMFGLQIYVSVNHASFVKAVNQKLNAAIAGDLAIKNIDLNVWRHFPNVDVRITDLTLKDSVYHRSLLNIKYASTRINAFKLFTDEVDIHNIYLEQGVIYLFTDKNGYSNDYIFKRDKAQQPGSHPAIIDEIVLKNIHFVSEHDVKDKWFGVYINYLKATLDFKDSVTTINMNENMLVRGLGFNLAKGYFLKGKTVKANWKFTYNSSNKQLSFDETPVAIGVSNFTLKGNFFLADTLNSHFKLIAKTNAINFKEAASLVSPNIQNKINLVNLSSKPIAVTATIEGPMAFRTIPIVNVQWVVKNNELVTPVVTLDHCNFTGSFTNEKNKNYPRTDDNSEVVLQKLSASWGGVSLIAKTNTVVTNLVHPVLQFNFTSATSLAALDQKLNLSTVHFMSGGALLNIQYNGPLGIDPAMLKYLSGNLVITDGQINYEPRDLTFSKCNGEIKFSETNVTIDSLQCDLNTNHFKVQLQGNNVNLFATNTLPGEASLYCNVITPNLNLGDFKALFQSRKTVEVKRSPGGSARQLVLLDNALRYGTLNINLKADTLHMDKFWAHNVQATLGFKNNDINVAKVSLLSADGSVNMQANIHQVRENFHQADANLSLQSINIQKLFYALDNFGMKGLTSLNISGTLNTKANLTLGFDNKGKIIPKTMLGNLHFSLKNGALKNFKPVTDIQEIIFKNRNLDDIQFAELKDSLELKGDEIYIHRMEIESSALTAFVEGIYSFGDNTNISIQVPLSNLKKRDDDYKVKNRGTRRKVGASVYLRAKPDEKGGVKIGLDLFKKLRGDNFAEDFKNYKPSSK
ncbi:MAG: hypothetical protein M3R72_09795 [Bacteroidota bacterium]|nr:hypothetical protein [Bacteroidota bacterium]